jgi:hypothetical protein
VTISGMDFERSDLRCQVFCLVVISIFDRVDRRCGKTEGRAGRQGPARAARGSRPERLSQAVGALT